MVSDTVPLQPALTQRCTLLPGAALRSQAPTIPMSTLAHALLGPAPNLSHRAGSPFKV